MIQRIQTIYLLITFGLCIGCLTSNIGVIYLTDGELVGKMYNLWVTNPEEGRNFAPWALFALLLITATITLLSIFLFKKRALQMRCCSFSTILLMGWYAVYAWFAYALTQQADAHFRMEWTAALPAVSIILLLMAFRAIKKDEMLVRSLDRLR